MAPRWVERLDQARSAGTAGYILSFVTTDRVIDGSEPPLLLQYFLASRLQAQGLAVLRYSLAEGLAEFDPAAGWVPAGDRARPGLGPQFEDLGASLRDPDEPCALIVDYADHLVPDQESGALLDPTQLAALELLHGWALDQEVRAAGSMVLLISHENRIHSLLRGPGSGFTLLPVGLPTTAQRRAFIDHLLALRQAGRAEDFGALSADLQPHDLAKATGGLRITDIEAMFRRAGGGGVVSKDMVGEAKATVVAELAQGLLEIHESSYGFDAVAGLGHAIDYFRTRHATGSLPPGVLLAGPPGVGKSFLVRAVAYELGLPCLAMRAVRERWVGASERNLERVLWIAETLQPVLMWMDEIDQAIGQRGSAGSSDSGTSERMLSRLWEFMGDTGRRRGILWIGTTNRPDLLDQATLDRFGVVIPFVHPSVSDVAAILPVLARQQGRSLTPDVDLAGLSPILGEGMPTVRGLQEVLAAAAALTDLDAGSVGEQIDRRHLLEAALDYKPSGDARVQELTALRALQMTTFQSLLPWRQRGGPRPGVGIPGYVLPLLDGKGLLDAELLARRIRHLQGILLDERALQGM